MALRRLIGFPELRSGNPYFYYSIQIGIYSEAQPKSHFCRNALSKKSPPTAASFGNLFWFIVPNDSERSFAGMSSNG